MLVLTRKQRQQLCIDGRITITVLQVKGQAVRLGIEAPEDVRVLRAELVERLDADAVGGSEVDEAAASARRSAREETESNEVAGGAARPRNIASCRSPRAVRAMRRPCTVAG